MDEKKETRTIRDTWDLSTYKWRIETDGLALLLSGSKDKKLLGRKCHKCGTVYIPGQKFCRKCWIDIDKVVEVENKGKVMTYTVTMTDVRGNPLEEKKIAAAVKMNGADTWFMGMVKGIDWEDVYVGMPVRIVWKEKTEGKIADMDYYEPI